MTESLEEIQRLIEECSDDERRALRLHLQKLIPHSLESEWNIDADRILTAIARSSDVNRRGVRGIIAEAAFVVEVAPTVETVGWRIVDFKGNQSYDAPAERRRDRAHPGQASAYAEGHAKRLST